MIDRFITCFPHLKGEEAFEIGRQIDEIESRINAIRDLTRGQTWYERNHCAQLGNSIYTILEILLPQVIACLKIQGLSENQAVLIQQEVTRRLFCSELAKAIRETILNPTPVYAETPS